MEILIIFILIGLNGIFSMSEIALVSARKIRLEIDAKEGNTAAQRALKLKEQPTTFLSTIQIGITLISILTGIYSGEKIEDDLVLQLNKIPALKPYSTQIAISTIVITLTFSTTILGELIPKQIGLKMPERIAKLMALPMYIISILASPIIALLSKTSELLIKLLGISEIKDEQVSEEEIKALLQESAKEGTIEEMELDIVERAFDLGDRKAQSLMTHRKDLVVMHVLSNVDQVQKTMQEKMHSVYPVVKGDMEIVGEVHLKDLFLQVQKTTFKLTKHIRKSLYVSENLSAYELFMLFKKERADHAMIVDEFGQLQGMVTMHDMLEALIGEYPYTHPEEQAMIKRQDGSYLFDGQFPFSEFLRVLNEDEMKTKYTIHTLSGLILHELRHIPKVGEVFIWRSYRIEIIDMDGVRIDKIMVMKSKPLQ